MDEEDEFVDVDSGDDDDEMTIRYDDDSMDDPISDGDDSGDEDGLNPLFKPLDTDDPLLF